MKTLLRPEEPGSGATWCSHPGCAFGFLTVLAVVLATTVSPASGADWYVDPMGNDGNTCMAPGPTGACMTIQAAINKAFANDTIHVGAGTYLEPAPGPLTVDKTLTLLGAQNGVDARTRGGAESIVSDPQGTSISASGVIIDGFTVQAGTRSATRSGMTLAQPVDSDICQQSSGTLVAHFAIHPGDSMLTVAATTTAWSS